MAGLALEDLAGRRFWQRKEISWAAVWQAGPVVDPAVLELVAALPVFRAAPSPCAYFPAGRPRFFVVVDIQGRRFLVNTEGYDYARYAVGLPPAPGE